MFETNYASETSEHFWLWPSRRAPQNREINRILVRKAWRVLSFTRRQPPRGGSSGYVK